MSPALPPLRKLFLIGYGSSQLECGHVVSTPRNRNTKRVRCTVCMPMKERQAYLAARKGARNA